jgi:arginine exporter protein ArgO
LFGLSLFWFGLLGMTLSRPLMRQRLLQVAPTIDFVCGLVFLLVALSIVGRLLS